jgi:hypothetical protein
LKFCFLLILKLSDLLNDSLKDLVGRHIIELSKGSVDSLGVMESDVLGAVASKDTLGFAAKNDFFDPLDVTILLSSCSTRSFLLVLSAFLRGELELIVHDSLLLVSLTSVVTALH